MQMVTPAGLKSAPVEQRLCTIEVMNGAPKVLTTALIEEWADCNALEAHDKLRQPDVEVTNKKDKRTQLPKILKLDVHAVNVRQTAFSRRSSSERTNEGVPERNLVAEEPIMSTDGSGESVVRGTGEQQRTRTRQGSHEGSCPRHYSFSQTTATHQDESFKKSDTNSRVTRCSTCTDLRAGSTCPAPLKHTLTGSLLFSAAKAKATAADVARKVTAFGSTEGAGAQVQQRAQASGLQRV